jgi:hypothetical protein
MSYAPLLRSLASTPRASWRVVAGTLLRQAFNEGLISAPAIPKTLTSGKALAGAESQRAEARRTGLTLYQVRKLRGASTGKGPNVRPRGPSTRISATRFVRDLRSVGWGGTESQIRAAYALCAEHFSLSAHAVVRQTDLNSFNARPPETWVTTHPRNNRDRFLGYAVLIAAVESSNDGTRHSSGELKQAREARTLPTVIETLDEIWDFSSQLTHEEIDKLYPWHTYPETLEYAGVRHITRGTYRRVRRS